jgi:hypothetical protein
VKRSEIIDLARSLILQGGIDPLWAAAEWDMMFAEAIDILHEAFIDSESDYFIKRDQVLTLTDGKYPLPADFHTMIWLWDDTGHIQAVDLEDQKLNEIAGFGLEDDGLVLFNFPNLPTTLNCDYYRLPKEIPVWDGSIDMSGDTYIPDAPFNTLRGARTIARIMQVIAQSKDGTNTDAVYQHALEVADRFVNKFLSRKESQ